MSENGTLPGGATEDTHRYCTQVISKTSIALRGKCGARKTQFRIIGLRCKA
jgi:hypothetical protein